MNAALALLLATEATDGLGRAGIERVFALFPRLAERKHNLAGTLSGGEQQMLAIGRALMAAPHLLIVDEASLGLTPEVMSRIWAALSSLRKEGLTLIVVEQRVPELLADADRAYVLNRGRVAFAGTPAALKSAEALQGLLTQLSEP
jgi:branched-chain amino acid transport system ATP-binding protein